MKGKEEKFFCGQRISIKEDGKDFYTTFLLATTHPDNASDDELGVVGDIIPKSTLERMAGQWDSNSSARKGSIHHKRGYEIPSVGQPGAKVVPLEQGHYGLMVTSKANRHFNDKEVNGYDYERFVDEVKDMVLDSVSMEYQTKDFEITHLDGKAYRVLKDVDLKGYGHASRPLNENAKVVSYGFKELSIEVKELEGKEIDNQTGVSTAVLPSDGKSVGKINTEGKTMTDDNTAKPITLSDVEIKEYLALKQEKEEKAKSEKLSNELKEIVKLKVEERMKELAPMMGLGNHFGEKAEMPEVLSYKEALRGSDLDLKYKAAANLVNAIGPMKLLRRSILGEGEKRVQNFECKGSMIVPKTLEVKEMASMKGMEVKALTTATNAEATYYQASAELNDIYEPVIFSQMNDQTRFYGRVRKVSYADRALIEFRVATARNSTADYYLETDTTFTAGQQTRVKFKQDFALARVICQVSGLEIASNQGSGGLGDIWGEEIRSATTDLLKKINTDLLTGSTGTYDGSAQNKPIGLQHLVNDTGTLYGKARGSIAALKGTDEAMSDAELTLGQLRKMSRTVRSGTISGAVKADADRNNLIFWVSPTLYDKFLSLLQSAQLIPVMSKRVGFEDEVEFDGVILMSDPDMDADDVFLIDHSHTFMAVKVAPTLSDLYLSDYDGKKAFIKTYFNLVSTKPCNNYWASGFKTT